VSAIAQPDATASVSDPPEAGTVYGRGYFGTLEAGGRLSLDRYETTYLSEMHRLAVTDSRGRPLAWPELFRRATRAEPGFGVRYLVYRDLRQRGYVVRANAPAASFAVLPRGGVLHKTPARYWVEPFSERVPFSLGPLTELASRAHAAKKTLLLGLVDEESDLTYYHVRRPTPSGSLTVKSIEGSAVGWLSEDRIVVFEPAAVEALGKGLAYGSRVGERLELSLLEAAYLCDTGQLKLKDARTRRTVSRERLEQRARRLDARFAERLSAYRLLRDRRLVVKTGFKYGAHFRAYPRNPEHAHARYLVQAVPSDHRSTWPEVAGSVRVAQGVRKQFVLAAVSPSGGVQFLSLERIRP